MIRLFCVIIGLCVIYGCATTTTLHTNSPDAEIFINGKRCNVSPCIYHSRYGFPDRIRIQIRAEGFKPAEFFIDTEAPLPSYLLWGVGSYVFHAFSTEYSFELYPETDTLKVEKLQKIR